MLALVALLLAAEPATPVTAWADKACPSQVRDDDPNVVMKGKESERVECLRRAMNRALDRVLLPLEAQKAPSFRPWMALQADFNRFVTDACGAAEEAIWISVDDNLRDWGTAYGYASMACQQDAYAWRGLFAESVAAGDVARLEAALDERAKAGADAEKAARAFLAEGTEASRRAPEKAAMSDGMRSVTREEWKDLLGTLERSFAATGELAKRQCALLAGVQVKDCEKRLAASYWTTLAFSDVREER